MPVVLALMRSRLDRNERNTEMPVCFSLTRKSDPESGPVSFNAIDEEMCAFFGEPCDPNRYYDAWYQLIRFGLASGKSFDELREMYNDMISIIDWLEDNFESDAWRER